MVVSWLLVVANCSVHKRHILSKPLHVRMYFFWLKECGLGNVIIETNCLNVANGINDMIVDRSYAGVAIKECVSLLLSLSNVKVCHVSHSTNFVAHILAKTMSSYSS